MNEYEILQETPQSLEVPNEVQEFEEDKGLIREMFESISEFFKELYETVADFFTDSKQVTDEEFEKLGEELNEAREFGINECTDAAIRIFTPEVIENWGNMTIDQRRELAEEYAAEVAKAFDLELYTGTIFEPLQEGLLGYNNGDGSIHLTDQLLAAWNSPLQIIDTITHELRHQYQQECINGYHDVPDSVREEWAVADTIYNYDQPSCYDPWGYQFNPLELDSRYAGETVVRNISNLILTT